VLLIMPANSRWDLILVFKGLRNRRLRNHGGIVRRCKASRQVLGHTQPSIRWVPVTNCIGLERPGHGLDKSLPPSEKTENVRCCAFTLPHSFMETRLNETQGEMYFHQIIMIKSSQKSIIQK